MSCRNSNCAWFATALLLTLAACQQRHKPVMVEYKTVFPVDTCISLREIPMQENLRSLSLLRLGDNRLLVFGDYGIVRLYSYPDLELIRSQQLVYRGTGVIGNELLLESQGTVDKYRLNTKDSLVCTGSFKIAMVPYSTGSVQRLDVERYIFADNYDLDGVSEYHVINIKDGSWQSGGEYPEPPARFKRLRDFKLAYAHDLSVKPDGSAFVVSYSYVRRVHIYNADGQLLHAVKLDYAPGNNNLPDLNGYWHHMGTVTTDNYIYMLNPEQQPPSPQTAHSEIVIMDWEGNLKVRYRLDWFVNGTIVDEARGVIVGCGDKGQGAAFFELNISDLFSIL